MDVGYRYNGQMRPVQDDRQGSMITFPNITRKNGYSHAGGVDCLYCLRGFIHRVRQAFILLLRRTGSDTRVALTLRRKNNLCKDIHILLDIVQAEQI